jgi:hypothetical protein
MSSPQVVQRIFEEGSEHSVNGVQIEVQVFELASRPHDRADQTGSETNDASQEGTTTEKDNEGASPSSEEQEVGESRSGGCTEEQPSSSNGQPNEGAVKEERPQNGESSSNENSESSQAAKPGDALPMSVGDWRQSRSTKDGVPDEAKERSTPKDTSHRQQSAADSSHTAFQRELLTECSPLGAHNSLTLQNVIGVIQKLYQDASKVDLADEMSQAVSELLSGPEEGQLRVVKRSLPNVCALPPIAFVPKQTLCKPPHLNKHRPMLHRRAAATPHMPEHWQQKSDVSRAHQTVTTLRRYSHGKLSQGGNS